MDLTEHDKNQACSDKESHTELKFFFKDFGELTNRISYNNLFSNSTKIIIRKTTYLLGFTVRISSTNL